MKNLLFCLLLLPIITYGQAEFPYFGKLSDEDLVLTTYEKDSSAAAVYLMNYAKARYDEIKGNPCFYYDYHYQIKILRKSAFDEADIAFSYLKKQPIENLKAVIHYIEDGERKSTTITDFPTKKISKYTESLNLLFPNVKEGVVIEYCYTVVQQMIVLPRDFYFQKKYPVKHGEYHFIFPGDENYQMLRPELEFDEFDYREVKMTKSLKTTKSLTEYWWKAFDIPGLPNEPFVNNVLDYRHRIRLQITQFGVNNKKGVDKYKYEWIALAVDFQRFLDRIFEYYRPAPAIRKIVKPLKERITGNTSDLEKVEILYNYIQENIEWNEQYTRFLTQKVEDTYKDKEGTSADINLLLYRLLKYYGMEVYPVLVSSRENGRIRKEYPFVEQFDHIVLQIKVYDKIIIVDATDKTYPYDLLPKAVLSEEGFLINGEASNFIGLNIQKTEQLKSAEVSLAATGIVSGKINVIHKNYAAHDVRAIYQEKGAEKYKTTYFEGLNNIEINSLELEHLEDKTKDLIENIEFRLNDETQITGQFIYFNPLLGLDFIEQPFKDRKRQLPIEMPYPLLKRTVIKIEIPIGYKIESLPENIDLTLPKSGGQYTFAITQKGNIIAITSNLYIKALRFEVEDYEAIKTFYDKLIEVQENQIILKIE